MLHKNLKTLKRSISEKLLGRTPSNKSVSVDPATVSRTGSATSSEPEEDPYREILRNYNDNVSHLVFHGSSLRSMSALNAEPQRQAAK